MEDRGERRQAVCARGCDLSQNVHLNRPQLTQRNTDIRRGSLTRNARIFPREKTAKAVVGCVDRKPVQVDRTQLIDHDIALRGDGTPDVVLVLAPDVDDNLVARTQLIVFRGRKVRVRLER